MYKQPKIYLLTPDLLRDEIYFQDKIIQNTTNNYYWTDDWSQDFYISLAKKGFICTSYDTNGGLVLLPELQFSYALLDFKDLHISTKVKKLLKHNSYIFSQNTNIKEVLKAISQAHKDNWLKGEYVDLLLGLFYRDAQEDDFSICTFELRDTVTQELIAGEVGYIIGDTYTSLSGFSSKERKYNNYGTLQLVLLAKYLQDKGFSFWNLGHPHMQYKKNLGAKVYKREDFLKRWTPSCVLPTIYSA